MKRIIVTALVAMLAATTSYNALGWGRDVHSTIAYIAELNLTPKAKANIEAAIGGRSIVYYASYMDNHRPELPYRHSSYNDPDTGRPVGDGIKEISATIEALSHYRDLPDSTLKKRIYHLVHVMGDFHCPGHTYFLRESPKKKKTNTHYDVVYINGNVMSYHTVWDTYVVRHFHSSYGYMDFAHSLNQGLTQEYIDRITAGNIEDWLIDVCAAARPIYDAVPRKPKGTPKEELSKITLPQLQEFSELADEYIIRAGLRMAKVINDSFGK